MPVWIFKILRNIAMATGILVAAGSIGHALNLCNPEWHEFGVSGKSIKYAIAQFPSTVCPVILRPACSKMVHTTLWFIGLDKESCE